MTYTTEPNPVAYQYRFRDPLSGNPVWRNSHAKWNGQEPDETRRLYDEETVQQLQQRCDRLLAVANTLAKLAQHDKNCLALQPLPTGCGYWHCTCGLSKIVLDGEPLEPIAESEQKP